MHGLTNLQNEILRRFFLARSEFFLTGGAALAGFHLHHRDTHDLDLFSPAAALDDAERTLRGIASDLRSEVETVQRSPSFRRFLMSAEGEAVVIDLVHDETPQLYEKVLFGAIRVDSAEEILANKLCTLLSRTEIRDLVDVAALTKAGLDPLRAIAGARLKDAGMTPSQLAWVLSTFPIPSDEGLFYGVARADLVGFRDDLVRKLAATAFPRPIE